MNGEVTYDTRFCFYPFQVKALAAGRYIAISTQSANWIVVDNKQELQILKNLQSGSTVGEVVELLENEGDNSIESLQKILAKLAAREFAGVGHLPEVSRLEGFRMLNLYVTNACNLWCPHCFMNAGQAMKNELSTIEIKNILDDFKAEGGECVTFTGGEPKMRPDFLEILQHSKSIGLSNTVLSNGLLWSEDDIQNASPQIEEIQISIDGVDENTNSTIRGQDHFRKAVETAKAFSRYGTKVAIATTFAQEDLNLNLVPQYLSLKYEIESESQNQVSFRFSKKILPGRGKTPTESQNHEYERLIDQIEDAVKPNAKMENFMFGHEPNMVSRNCGIGGISIRSDGHVFLCNRVHEVDDYGHISNQSMAEWLQIAKDINDSTAVDNVEPCKTCFLKNICNGGCRIDDFNNKGQTRNQVNQWVNTTCTEDRRGRLLDKMVKMFDLYYDFSQ